MIVALYSQAFVASGSAHDKFKVILNATYGIIDATGLDEDHVCGHDVSRFVEWAKISMTKWVAGDILTLLKSFMRDMSSCTTNTDEQIGCTMF